MNIATTKERILQIVDYKKVKKSDFYKKNEIKRGVLDTDKLKTSVSDVLLAKIIANNPEINPEWLLTGKGGMLRSENEGSTNYKDVGTPYYDVDFLGGFDLTFNDQTINADCSIQIKGFDGIDFWVNITGKSMEPQISHGDIVALKQIYDWKTFLEFGEIYAIITNETRTIKIISKSDKSDHFKLIPINNDGFVEQDIPISIITQIFMVKGAIKKFF